MSDVPKDMLKVSQYFGYLSFGSKSRIFSWPEQSMYEMPSLGRQDEASGGHKRLTIEQQLHATFFFLTVNLQVHTVCARDVIGRSTFHKKDLMTHHIYAEFN